MNSRVIVSVLSLGLTTTAAGQWASHTQLAEGNSGAAGISAQGIGLTASHKQIIYDKIIGERSQSLPGDQQAPSEDHSRIRSCSTRCRSRLRIRSAY